MLVLETDSAGDTIVNAIEVLDSGHNRVSCIVRIYLNAHGDSCPDFRVLVQKQFKRDVLWDGARRQLVREQSATIPINISMIIRGGGVPLCSQRLLVLHGLHDEMLVGWCCWTGRQHRLFVESNRRGDFRRGGV
jgi:hypothetical protein